MFEDSTMKYRKYIFNDRTFEVIDTPDKAYWLGFLMGDGNINQKSSALYLEISNKDVDHLEKFKKFIKGNQPIKPTRKDCSRIIVCGKKFINTLGKFGIVKNKTYYTKTPPINSLLLPDFYRGILDSDGWVCKHQSQHEFGFSSACENFIKEIQQWIELNIKKSCGCITQRVRGNQKVWQLIIGGNKNFQSISRILYPVKCNSYLERKHAIIKQFLDVLSIH